MSETLLPANATPAERALEAATARLGAVPIPVGGLWNADTCPAALLPWLAWAVSLDEWNPDWTEAQKRAAIRSSYYVHAHKGTVAAVERALAAVDYAVRLVEPADDAGLDPYTFRADVEVSGRGIDAATLAEITRLIMGSKNLRSQLVTVRAIGVVRGTVHPAAYTLIGNAVTVQPFAVGEITSAGPAYWAAGCAFYSTTTIYPGV